MLNRIYTITAGIATALSLTKLILSLFLGLGTGAIISSVISLVCFGAITILSIIVLKE